jgi:hypothetical protein
VLINALISSVDLDMETMSLPLPSGYTRSAEYRLLSAPASAITIKTRLSKIK